ncbi:MAG: RodZ domain-containing protein [bacterium]
MSELHLKIGKLLRMERRRRSLTLEELSVRLKISINNLESIENGRPDALPAELYFDLFAKSYAEALEIDYIATVEAIKEDIGQPLESSDRATGKGDADSQSAPAESDKDQPATAAETMRGNRFLRTFIILLAVVVGAFLVFMVVNWLFLEDDQEAAISNNPAPADPVEAAGDNRSGPDSLYASYDWNVPPYPEPQEMQLQLIASGESWATVLADGDTAIYRTLVPGKVYTVPADYRYVVSIAWPSRVAVTLNGTPVNLRNPSTLRISRVAINQKNLDSVLNPPEITSDTATGSSSSSRQATVKTPVTATESSTVDSTSGETVTNNINASDNHER